MSNSKVAITGVYFELDEVEYLFPAGLAVVMLSQSWQIRLNFGYAPIENISGFNLLSKPTLAPASAMSGPLSTFAAMQRHFRSWRTSRHCADIAIVSSL